MRLESEKVDQAEMELNPEKDYEKELETQVLIQRRVVTYSWLAVMLHVPFDVAARMLYAFWEKNRTTVTVTHLLIGSGLDEGMRIALASENSLSEQRAQFSTITTDHIYSIHFGALPKAGADALVTANTPVPFSKELVPISCPEPTVFRSPLRETKSSPVPFVNVEFPAPVKVKEVKAEERSRPSPEKPRLPPPLQKAVDRGKLVSTNHAIEAFEDLNTPLATPPGSQFDTGPKKGPHRGAEPKKRALLDVGKKNGVGKTLQEWEKSIASHKTEMTDVFDDEDDQMQSPVRRKPRVVVEDSQVTTRTSPAKKKQKVEKSVEPNESVKAKPKSNRPPAVQSVPIDNFLSAQADTSLQMRQKMTKVSVDEEGFLVTEEEWEDSTNPTVTAPVVEETAPSTSDTASSSGSFPGGFEFPPLRASSKSKSKKSKNQSITSFFKPVARK